MIYEQFWINTVMNIYYLIGYISLFWILGFVVKDNIKIAIIFNIETHGIAIFILFTYYFFSTILHLI